MFFRGSFRDAGELNAECLFCVQVPVRHLCGRILRHRCELAVFDSPPAVVGMQQLCPGDDRRYDEEFGLKFDVGIVEDLHRREHCFACSSGVRWLGNRTAAFAPYSFVADAVLLKTPRRFKFRAASYQEPLLL